jgi:RimJ/RimL family protein N-acetyltransferase
MNVVVNDRLFLSEIVPADRAACVRYLNDRDIYDQTLRIPYPYSEADFERWLGVAREATRQHGRPAHWAIRHLDGSLIGGLGFQNLAIGKSHQAEIGYWLGQPFWGQGIMTEVVGRVCAYAQEEFSLVRIIAHVYISNVASARVLEKCGFQQEGILRKHCLKDGRFLDVKLFALVK